MVFTYDKLHCDIFALVLFIQWIFVEPCKLANISLILFFFIHCWHYSRTLCLWCLKISESNSIYVSSMAF